MNEELLQFIWQFQYFDLRSLATLEEDALQIIHPGKRNHDQGPDFISAKISVGGIAWSGNVEIHVLASDWYRHGHQHDERYNNVILHVVWKYDLTAHNLLAGIPSLELQSRVSMLLLNRYETLLHSTLFVPCVKSMGKINPLLLLNWKERLLAERLQRKSAAIMLLLEQSKYHWEETFWWLIARSFGMLVNADAFELIARSISLTILVRHKQQIHQLEALLFGQAGLLHGRFMEKYPLLLQKEYRFYRKKYGLKQVAVAVKMLRMRPSSFPTVRLAQLAMLIHTSDHLLSAVLEKDSLKDVANLLDISANDYWHYHYRFEEATNLQVKHIGSEMISNILINTLVPILFTYGSYHREQAYIDKALRWLDELLPEKNKITRGWAANGIHCKTAFDSQALLELKTNYCDYKRCLECHVGNALLKPSEP
ncbi:MAG: DUF2851 family protein [Williamsia sp.]|nr:DUF2851 family protein [Williamsia sp.]